MRSIRLALIAAGALCAAGASAQPQAILGVNVIDVERGALRAEQTVVVTDGKITWIGPAADAPEVGGTVVQGQGLYMIPGLIDSHTHFVDPTTYAPLMIAHGVVLVREMGSSSEAVFPLRDSLNSGDVLGPEMIACGEIIDGNPPVWPFSEPCDTPQQARDAVDRLAARGADQIKLYSMLKPDVFAAACQRARELGLKPVGHVPLSLPIEDTLDSGFACVEHLTGVDAHILALVRPGMDHTPDFVEASGAWMLLGEVEPLALAPLFDKIARAGQVHCPTLVVMEGVGSIASGKGAKNPAAQYVAPRMRSFWETPAYAEWSESAGRSVPRMQRVVKMMHDAGVTLIAGTDLANPYVFAGESLHRELELLRNAGLSPIESLRAATITPAAFHGVADRLGTIEVGKDASFVLLREDPLQDISATRSIEHVFLRGRHFDRPALDALLQQALDAATQPEPEPENASRLDEFALPGVAIHRGTYATTFGGQPAGVEDFIVTRADDGWHVAAHNRPLGGFQQPFLLHAHADEHFALTSVEYRQLSDPELRVDTTIADGVIVAGATRAGQPAGAQRIDIPADALLATPALIGDFLAMRNLGLEPGQTRHSPSLSFGFPTWQWSSTDVAMTRLDDTTLQIAGRERAVSNYRTELATAMGAFTITTWIDERGLPVKWVIDMPFGQVVSELQE